MLIIAVFPFSLFWQLTHQLFKRLTWLGVTLGNVVFFLSFEVFVREPPLFHPWLCLWNTSLEAELKLWIINVSEPELRTRARSPWDNINIQNVQTCKFRGTGEMPVMTPEVKWEPLVPSFTHFHSVALSSLVHRPCGLHFNCFQSKFDEFVTQEEAGKCSGLLWGGTHRQIWGIPGWSRHSMADFCEDFNTATMTAMLGPFYAVIWNRNQRMYALITHTIRALPYL